MKELHTLYIVRRYIPHNVFALGRTYTVDLTQFHPIDRWEAVKCRVSRPGVVAWWVE